MARIVFTTFGSWGDLFPMVPVAQLLASRGHQVSFAATPAGAEFVGESGIGYKPIGIHLGFDEYARNPEILDSRLGGLLGLRHLLRLFAFPHLEQTTRDLAEFLSGADLLVCHPVQLAGPLAAELTGVPWVTFTVFPGLLPTRRMPAVMLGDFRAPGPLAAPVNAVSWAGLQAALGTFFDPPLNRIRRRLDLAPRRRAFFSSTRSSRLAVLACSPSYHPPPGDWPAELVVTGFTSWDRPDLPDPDGLWEFVHDGPPPVVITLGASLAIDPQGFFDVARSAVVEAGLRGVMLVGRDANLAPDDERLRSYSFVPLSKLLPSAALVVHHGGFSTTAATLAAARPSVVVPRAFDQMFHASRVKEIGAGRRLFWRHLDPSRLAAEMRAVLTDSAYEERALDMSRRLDAEDGPREAADAIERALD